MKYTLEKIERIIKEIEKNIYTNEFAIDCFMKKEGFFKSIEDVENSNTEWIEVKTDEFWGGVDKNSWYKFDIKIPENFKDQTVALFVSTGDYDLSKEETTTNPQILFYKNGEIIQGFDINHREYILEEKSIGTEKYRIDLKVNSGMFERKFNYKIMIVTVDENARNLFYNIKVPHEVAKNSKDEFLKIEITELLKNTINKIDFRQVGSDEYKKSIEKANEYIESEFYGNFCNQNKITASVIGHTHIDVAWLWTVAQTREKIVRSFSTVLSLMAQYPEYKFMSSTPLLYEFLKEDYPEIYSKVKEKISEGRWEADGGMWVESDCNLVSGRSLSRQFLYGKNFFQKEFAVDSKVLWLPDAFGYCGSLPQIMKKSGIDYFVSCKMGWSDTNRLPYDTFMWRGIDGTEILSHMITTTYPRQSVTSYATDYNGQLFPEPVMGAWNTYRHRDINKDVLITFGYGDGGGGPTKEMLEYQRRMNKGIPGCPKTEMCTVNEYFEKLENKLGEEELPKWVGELYLETHRGTYTSMSRNKKSNRKSDILIGNLEKLSSINSKLSNKNYDRKTIDNSWKTILRNQFHDILPGSAIEEVYDVTKKEYDELEKKLTKSIDKNFSEIVKTINVDSESIIVFNTLSFERNGIVDIYDPNNKILGNTVMDLDTGKAINIENSNNHVIFFVEKIPPMGYKVYKISNSNVKSKSLNYSNFVFEYNLIENKFFKVKLESDGTISYIYDKRSNREILKNGERGNKIICYENKPIRFENWNIDNSYKDKSWEINNVISSELIEDTNIRKIFQVKKSFFDSVITQNIIFYSDIPRIDFETSIDLKTSDILLKAQFPLDVNTNHGTFETAYGNVKRTAHNNTSWDIAQFEVPAHRWMDISEFGFGVSLLNDSKYGYSIKNNNIEISLLKPGKSPNKICDIENHKFLYSLYPHLGSWQQGSTHKEAECLNEPLVGLYSEKNLGNLNKKLSFFNLNCENVVIDTVKIAEKSNDIIVIVYEYFNKRTSVEFSSHFNISKVIECNMLEEEEGQIFAENNSFKFEIKPYEIKIFKLKTL